jgi:ferredoxin/flavodoxin
MFNGPMVFNSARLRRKKGYIIALEKEVLVKIKTVSCVYFSPTGTTKAIVENIALGMGAENIDVVDCTKRYHRGARAFDKEIVIMGTPVYYGRVPEEAADLLARFTGKNAYAVVVVVYGNRAYDDSLKELFDIAVAQGFTPIAGAAFIGEHSYSSSAYPIAAGRPDQSDLDKARVFGRSIRKKLVQLESPEKETKDLTMPGHVPYIEAKNLALAKQERNTISLTPEPDTALCTRCGKCAEVCPTGAISPDDPGNIDKWQCLICFACVKNCPSGARRLINERLDARIKELSRACQSRKEPEWYL